MVRKRKSDPAEPPIEIHVSPEPGICFACRHANQNTPDFEREHVFCQLQPGRRTWKSQCNVSVVLESRERVFLFEPFDGKNCTWGTKNPNLVIMPPKA